MPRQIIWRCTKFALLAVESLPYVLLSTRLRNNPGPLDPRRGVAHVLEVAARQLRDPVILIVEVETGNGLFHWQGKSKQRIGASWLELWINLGSPR